VKIIKIYYIIHWYRILCIMTYLRTVMFNFNGLLNILLLHIGKKTIYINNDLIYNIRTNYFHNINSLL